MKRFLTVAAIVLAGFAMQAQPVIGLQAPTPVANFNKQVLVTDTAKYRVTVVNKGNQNFTGTIALQTEIDTGTGLIPFQLDSFTVPAPQPLTPSDTISFPLKIFPYSSPGITTQSQGNIVVIWPINGVDSFVDTFWVQVGSFVYENPVVFEAIDMFPVPASHSVNIRVKRADVSVERVRIFDLNGRLVTDEISAAILDVSRLAAGRYVIQLQLKTGEIGRYDLIKN